MCSSANLHFLLAKLWLSHWKSGANWKPSNCEMAHHALNLLSDSCRTFESKWPNATAQSMLDLAGLQHGALPFLSKLSVHVFGKNTFFVCEHLKLFLVRVFLGKLATHCIDFQYILTNKGHILNEATNLPMLFSHVVYTLLVAPLLEPHCVRHNILKSPLTSSFPSAAQWLPLVSLFLLCSFQKWKTMLACVGAKLTSSHDKQPVRMHSKQSRRTKTKGKSTEDTGKGKIKVEAWRLEVSTWRLVNGELRGGGGDEGRVSIFSQPWYHSLLSSLKHAPIGCMCSSNVQLHDKTRPSGDEQAALKKSNPAHARRYASIYLCMLFAFSSPLLHPLTSLSSSPPPHPSLHRHSVCTDWAACVVRFSLSCCSWL